jgi:hypothetical protein
MSSENSGPDASAGKTPDAAAESGRALSPAQLDQRRTAASKPRRRRSEAQVRSAARAKAEEHGLFAGDVVNPKIDGRERAAEFQALLATFRDDLAPVGALERLLVEEIAVCCWRLRRALRSECREAWAAEVSGRDPTPIATLAEALRQSKRIDALEELAPQLELAKLDTLLVPPEGPAQSILRFESSVKEHLHRALKMLIQLQDKRRAQNAAGLPAGGRKNATLQNQTSAGG